VLALILAFGIKWNIIEGTNQEVTPSSEETDAKDSSA